MGAQQWHGVPGERGEQKENWLNFVGILVKLNSDQNSSETLRQIVTNWRSLSSSGDCHRITNTLYYVLEVCHSSSEKLIPWVIFPAKIILQVQAVP